MVWAYRSMSDLEVQRGERPRAARHAIDNTALHAIATADQILAIGSIVILVLDAVGAVRPIRRSALYLIGATALVLVVAWLATRSDVAAVHSFTQRTL